MKKLKQFKERNIDINLNALGGFKLSFGRIEKPFIALECILVCVGKTEIKIFVFQ